MRTRHIPQLIMSMVLQNIVVLLWGPPGIGKSELVMQAAKMMGYEVMVMFVGLRNPTDFNGLGGLNFAKGIAEFLPYGDMHKMMTATAPLLVFLDDLATAPQAVQTAVAQLVQAREINGLKISPFVRFVIATNDRKHRSGANSVVEMLKGRAAIVEVKPELEDWIADYAIPHDVNMLIPAYLRFRPENFNKFEPTADLTNSPNSRNWTRVHGVLMAKMIEAIEAETIEGCVGRAAGGEFMVFKEDYLSMPSIDGILLNPKAVPLPPADKLSVYYAVAVGLASKVTKANFPKIVDYAMRLELEAQKPQFGMFLIRDCQQRDNMLIATAAGQQLAKSGLQIAKAFELAQGG